MDVQLIIGNYNILYFYFKFLGNSNVRGRGRARPARSQDGAVGASSVISAVTIDNPQRNYFLILTINYVFKLGRNTSGDLQVQKYLALFSNFACTPQVNRQFGD